MPTNQQKPQSQQSNKPQQASPLKTPGQTQQRQGSNPAQSTDKERDFSRQNQN